MKDTRRLLIHLKYISYMEETRLQKAVASIPRTTITELFRAIDPVVVAKNADPTDQIYISHGAFQSLNLGATIDIWGVRRLYSQLLRYMLVILSALKATGGILLAEEYVYLLRCAGAASDVGGIKWVWNEMIRTNTSDWRHGGLYDEFVSARFLINPSYTGYDKTRRMVTGRSLHQSKFILHWRQIRRLDWLRYHTRVKKLFFGLNKDTTTHAEDLIRIMRKDGPAGRIFHFIRRDGIFMDESLASNMMVAFGRAGSLRFIKTVILEHVFDIDLDKITSGGAAGPTPPETDSSERKLSWVHIRPGVLLMKAVVETYGSNAEISLALQLVKYISETYQIPIPSSVWKDLLEWTYIMSAPPTSTGWKIAKMFSKSPKGEVVELIWDMMVSEPYCVQPEFEHYEILIRAIIGQHRFGKFLPYMREALTLYNFQCREYEEAVIEYVQMINNGVRISETVHRYQRARARKATMRYSIQTWCRQFLNSVRSFNPTNPLVVVAVPDFINEFRAFIPNPATYRTSTGYVALFDPSREADRLFFAEEFPLSIQLKNRLGEVLYLDAAVRKFASVSTKYTLAGRTPISYFNLQTLLTTTGRSKLPGPRDGAHVEEGLEESTDGSGPEPEPSPEPTQDAYDDDEDIIF
ncbi:mitochondrial ATPase expression-domain-containing protein [Daldinia caldariorum]|uniref:mitochondrial ATPase expression-domain-containing protein n=1 Tax=Daldinia caldariorum TaxID=326644 RepID=UPI002007A464|nr:mitochondrial ATPase expression-domain-containing protein [Daldinia caldariorum]KAI1465075.1 mitochondrial ATPase expression-domain-containing protein [Daldinia caldariorum]